MMQVKPLGLAEIRAVEYECECGSMGRLTIDDQGRSVTCAVLSPDTTTRVRMKEDGLDEESPPGPIDDVLIIEEL